MAKTIKLQVELDVGEAEKSADALKAALQKTATDFGAEVTKQTIVGAKGGKEEAGTAKPSGWGRVGSMIGAAGQAYADMAFDPLQPEWRAGAAAEYAGVVGTPVVGPYLGAMAKGKYAHKEFVSGGTADELGGMLEGLGQIGVNAAPAEMQAQLWKIGVFIKKRREMAYQNRRLTSLLMTEIDKQALIPD